MYVRHSVLSLGIQVGIPALQVCIPSGDIMALYGSVASSVVVAGLSGTRVNPGSLWLFCLLFWWRRERET